jgi:hypothetical protein
MISPVYVTTADTSDENGNVTFNFLAMPTDVWLVTVSVPAGLTGSFNVTSAAVSFGTWQGAGGIGPLWIPGPGSVQVTGTNLTPNTPYSAIAQGSQGTMMDFPPQAPAAGVGTVQATRTQQAIVTGTIGPGDSSNITVPLSPNWRSVYVGSNTGEVNVSAPPGSSRG